MSPTRAPKAKTKTIATPYLVPGRDGASETHEQVCHGDETQPDHHGEEAQQLLKHGLDAHEDEDREENRQGGGDRYQKCHVVFSFLRGEKKKYVAKVQFRDATEAVTYVIQMLSAFIGVEIDGILKTTRK